MSTAAYLMVVDTDDYSFETLAAPETSAGRGAGIKIITHLLDMEAQVLMGGYMAPHIAQSLEKSGIEVILNVSGSVRQAVEQYQRRGIADMNYPPNPNPILDAGRKTAKQFFAMAPVLGGVILLMGLIPVFLSKPMILSVFSGNPLKDTIFGAFIGSLFAGNPINSYVIGQSLMELGASLFGVCALMMTWVSVGLVQLPAEISAMGLGFALIRNLAAFMVAIPASILVVMVTGLMG